MHRTLEPGTEQKVRHYADDATSEQHRKLHVLVIYSRLHTWVE